MIRTIVLWDCPGFNAIPAMQRFYLRYHGPEIVGRYRAWLRHSASYRVVPAPPDAASFGYYNYRLVEFWWDELPPTIGTCAFTPQHFVGRGQVRGTGVQIPPQPTDEFPIGWDWYPDQKTILRWFMIFKYPEGVPVEEGEKWYLNVHAKEVMKQPGLTKFFSYRALKPAGGLPGHRPPPPDAPQRPRRAPWIRVSEQWYEDFNGWRKSVIESPPKYTKPSWAKYDKYPFLEPNVDFVSTFLLELPDNDFLRDLRDFV